MPERHNKRKATEEKESKSAVKLAEKPAKHHTNKSVHKHADKHAKKLVETPVENRTEQPAQTPAQEPVDTRSSKHSDKRSSRRSERRTSRHSDKHSDHSSDKTTLERADRPRRRVQNPIQNPMLNPIPPLPLPLPQYKPLEKRSSRRAERHFDSPVESVPSPDERIIDTPAQEAPVQTPADNPANDRTDEPPVGYRKKARIDRGRTQKIVPMEDWETQFSQALLLHHQGIAGDKQAAKEAYQLLDRILNAVPDNNLVRAYCGSATSLMGRDVPSPKDKLKFGKKGLILLDEAVSDDPNNLEIRTLRALVCKALPEKYFHRTRNAIEDFNFIVAHYVPGSGSITQEMYWKILYDLGTACKRMDRYREAEAAWEKLLSITTDPKYRALLAEEGLTVPGLASEAYTSTASSDEEEISEHTIKLYQLALTGDKNDAKNAFDNFDDARREQPANPVIKAYYADCLSLKARHEDEASLVFAGAYEAVGLLDSAVNSRPNSVKIRLLRAYNSHRLPEAFFHRTTTAIEDFEYLIGRYEEDPTVFSAETYEQLLYDLGKAYQRLELDEESEDVFQTLLSVNPDTKYQPSIRSKNTKPDYAAFYSAERETLFKEGERLHQLAVAGDKKASELSHDLWKRAHQAFAGDPLAAAYYGSSIALLGRDASEPQNMFQSIFEGLKYVNQAADSDPDNAQVRLIRAYFLYSLPESFFHMTERAITDFEQVVTAYRQQPDETITQELYHQILYDLGNAYRRVGTNWKAQQVWYTLLNESSDPKYQELKERMYRV